MLPEEEEFMEFLENGGCPFCGATGDEECDAECDSEFSELMEEADDC